MLVTYFELQIAQVSSSINHSLFMATLRGRRESGPFACFWATNTMGLKPSPYNYAKTAILTEEVCNGDRNQIGLGTDRNGLNLFQWQHTQLNCPAICHDPTL